MLDLIQLDFIVLKQRSYVIIISHSTLQPEVHSLLVSGSWGQRFANSSMKGLEAGSDMDEKGANRFVAAPI